VSAATNNEIKEQMEAQPSSTRGLSADDHQTLIVSMRKVDGIWVIVSRYGDDIWWLTGSPTNVTEGQAKLDFSQIPEHWRASIKACLYRLMTRGREGGRRPSVTGLISTFAHTRIFLQYLVTHGVDSLSAITPLLCFGYVQASRSATGKGRWGPRTKPLSPAILGQRFRAVELLYELSQFSDDPMPQHPWPESSSDHLSKASRVRREGGNTTPLMSDEVFVALFQKAWALIQSAGVLLDLRDEVDAIGRAHEGKSRPMAKLYKNRFLREQNWEGNLASFVVKLSQLRTACYIVVASLSGCRNHEISFLQSNACYSTVDDQGERYWWMRSISKKTGVGATEWMIPEAAVTALRIMDRWAVPFQVELRREIEAYRAADPTDVRIALAQQHLGAIFVGSSRHKGKQVRTLSRSHMTESLKDFAKLCGLEWNLASHQFRRKFANYAARSRFGDLRYLKEHFKHWSLDMTLGYALNDSQEMALYLEIEDELEDLKQKVVAEWMNDAEPLAGGYGLNLVAWRGQEEKVTLFKNHSHMIRVIAATTAIRANGQGWCTADDDLCDGNDIDPTRCGDGCNNSVIGRRHAPIYIALYNDLKTLEGCDDIGEGGRARVARDLARCRNVLTALGWDPLKAVE
jgi:integrase